MNKFNYENEQYLHKLEELPLSYYSKYIEYLRKFLKNNSSKFLDVGCGNGTILRELKKRGYENGYGIDISKLFVNEARKRRLKNIYYYDGDKFPFKKEFFDLIGSFNVLEHTQNPEKFILGQISLLKPNGFIIVACPNFLSSILPSPHPRIKGIKNRFKNFQRVVLKVINNDSFFEKMPPIKRRIFQYDDDAIVVTNLIDLKRILKRYNCEVIYESGFINYDSLVFRLIGSIPLMKYFLPSCFVVAQKSK